MHKISLSFLFQWTVINKSKKIRLLNIICKWDHCYTIIKFCVISLWIKQVVAYEKTCMEEQRDSNDIMRPVFIVIFTFTPSDGAT